MMYRLIFAALLLISFSAFSQGKDRVVVDGRVTAPIGEDVEGVHIYNTATEKGIVTSADGSFLLEMGENDRLRVTALQFQGFTVIVDKGIIDVKKVHIALNPTVNQLDEVVVRPYDLSGNIKADIGRVKVLPPPTLDLSYEALTFEYDFINDTSTSIEGNKAQEAYTNGQVHKGADFLGLIGLLFKKKKKNDPEAITTARIGAILTTIFPPEFISENFGIPDDKSVEFLYYLEENGIEARLLKDENRLLLIDFLRQQSELYKEQLHRN